MKKLNILGMRTKYIFQDDQGNVAVQYGLAADYTNPNRPTLEGYVLRLVKLVTQFDTPDGEIHEDQYALYNDGAYGGEERVLIRLSSGKFLNLSKTDTLAIKALAENSTADTYKGKIGEIDVEKVKEIPDSDLT